mmetsp:Transcript_47656/g.102049  ORF Transcript_47656/g.102049 Transcript_47656/m.102049 type:complete len:199 (-) Transcript_47656:238-834(-)
MFISWYQEYQPRPHRAAIQNAPKKSESQKKRMTHITACTTRIACIQCRMFLAYGVAGPTWMGMQKRKVPSFAPCFKRLIAVPASFVPRGPELENMASKYGASRSLTQVKRADCDGEGGGPEALEVGEGEGRVVKSVFASCRDVPRAGLRQSLSRSKPGSRQSSVRDTRIPWSSCLMTTGNDGLNEYKEVKTNNFTVAQ